MYYVTKGDSITTHCEHSEDFFCKMLEQLKFSYDVVQCEMNDRVVKDIVAEEEFSNEEFLEALSSQEYDTQNYLILVLDSFLSITDVDSIICGDADDRYSVDDEEKFGDQYTFAELAYENEWNVISFDCVNVDNMVKTITKNSHNRKKVYNISDRSQLLLSKSLKDETYLSKYFCAFENVYCTKNCNFDNWNSLNEAERFRVLSIFLKEIVHVLYNEFSKLGRFPGRNSNRVEKINDNLFEYRISNPNYRIYYSRFENKLIILKTLLKRRQSISTDTMNNLLRLVKQPYEKT